MDEKSITLTCDDLIKIGLAKDYIEPVKCVRYVDSEKSCCGKKAMYTTADGLGNPLCKEHMADDILEDMKWAKKLRSK